MKRTIVLLITITIIVLLAKFPHLMLNPGELSEGHQKIKNDCVACHSPFWGIETSRCISCHKIDEIGLNDSSKNKLAVNKEMVLFHSKLKDQECISCHSDHNGLHPKMSIKNFDHELLSANMKTNCNSCHGKPVDKLHNQLSVSCNSCHNTKTWESSGTFNHDLIIKVDKANCTACHQKPSDSFHQLSLDNCDKCHTTNKWSPSTFDHSPYFILDKDHNPSCNTCHTNNNFNAFTCYGCHEHSENKIIQKHEKHGILNFADCASCHRSADEHDIRYNGNKREINSKEINNIKEYIKSDRKDKRKKKKDKHDD